MKITIRSNPTLNGQRFWAVQTPTSFTCFEYPAGAFAFALKYAVRHRKEMSAFSMLQEVSTNLLNIQDAELIKKLRKTKCKGITKSQYGYLKGIHERQEREW